MAYDQYTDPLDITGWSYEQIVQKSREIGNSQLYVSINGITCRLNIPETINKDTSFIVLGRGAGSFASDTGSIFNDMITEKSNTFVVLPINQGDTNQLVDKYKVCYDFTKSIQEANKVDTPVVIHGYSNSGGNAIAAGCEIASRGQKVIVVTCDPANDSAAKYFENANENLTVICLAEDTNGYSERFDRFNSQLQSKGAKTVLVELHGCGHKDLKSQILTDFNLQEFISKGFNINDLLEKGYSLSFYTYDENNKRKEITDQNEINNILNGLCSSYTSSLLRLDSSTLSDGTVASDLYAVAQAMNNINNSIKNNSALQGMNYVTDSTSSIPSKLYDVQSSVLGITSGVVNNLSQETSLIANMANVIYEMDKDLANRAGNLSNGDGLLTKYSDQIEAELNKVIDNNITGMLNIRESLFSPGTHAEGTIGKICASDIGQMISGGKLTGALKDNIESEYNDAQNTKAEIDNFKIAITSSKNLQGEMWKKVGVKLDKYSNLMDLRMESMNKLETAYEESLNLIKDYMGEYEYLDDSELPELRQALTELKSAIDNAKNILSKTHEETRTKGEGDNITTYTVTVYDYSASARAAASAYIKWAGEQVIEVEKLITKLEGLADIMSQAEQIINDALIEIYGKYGTEANSIVTGKKSEYIPPSNTNYTPKRLSEDAFNKDKILTKEYGTYDNYKNYNKISKYDASIKGEYNQYTRHEFLVRSKPVEEFGTYENYLQGVKKEDDPAFNKEIEDNGEDIDIDLKIPEKGIIESIQEAQKKQEDLAKDAQSKQSSASPSSRSSSPSNSHSGASSNSSDGSSTQPSSEPSKEEPTNNVEPQTPTDQGDIKVEPTDNQTEKPVEEIKTNENKPSQTIPTTPSKPSKPSKPSSSIPNNRINSGIKETNKVETPEIIEIEPIEIEPIEEEPIIVEPIIEPKIEEPIEIKPIEITPTSESTEETSKANSTLKTVGTILGVGAAVGATAFGAHTVMKARENNNIYESDEEEEE